MNNDASIICNLKDIRKKSGITQEELAKKVGLGRQAIYDIESGKYLPNTMVAIRLARHLNCTVEDLFTENIISEELPVSVVEDSITGSGKRLAVSKIRGKLIAYPLDGEISVDQGIQAADGFLSKSGDMVKLLCKEDDLDKSAFLLGCDPAFSLLSSYVARAGGEERLKWRFASSRKALEGLASGHAHMAGVHMHNKGRGESNKRVAKKYLSGMSAKLIAFAYFDEGLMVRRGNPKKINSVKDLAKKNIKMINREEGAALRVLLDDYLEQSGLTPEMVNGYDEVVYNHLSGAREVLYGACDVALGLKAVAEDSGLDFIPLESVRSDILIPEDVMDNPTVKLIMKILKSSLFKEELGSLPGYDSSITGEIIAEI